MNILCPIDFSEHSLYALDYAIKLGNSMGAKIVLFTAYSVPKSTGRLRSLDEEIRKSVVEDLEEVLKEISPKITTGIKAEIGVMEGNSGRVINEYAKYHHMDLIVMGTQGKGSISNIFLGSVAKKVADYAEVPVIAIPFPIKTDLNPKSIVLNIDEKPLINETSIKFLRNYLQKLDVEMDVYHVITSSENDNFEETVSKFEDLVHHLKTEQGDNVTEKIKQNAEHANYGMMVMIRRPHSFWSRLFMDTHTTSELAMTRIPIMVLPE